MKMRHVSTRAHHLSSAKLLIPILATTAIAGGVDAGFLGRVLAAPVEVTYNGSVYTLDTTSCFAPGKILGCSGAKDFRSSSWFGNSQLAKNLSEATKDLLGLPNSSLGTGLGPNFAWKSGDPAIFNESALPFDGFEWDPVLNIAYSRGGLWNSFTGIARSGSSTLAIEAAAPRPLGPILAANNGTSINTTASLAAKTLLPQFEGGTLVVSATNTVVADNFTLNDSRSNTIDAAGNNSTFSSIFSDKAGSKGNIGFKNTGVSGAITGLIGQSTYSGKTAIFDNAILQIGVDNALPMSTELIMERNGRLNLGGFDQTVSSLFGRGTIDLGSGTLTINRVSASAALSGASISGTGSLIKDGAFSQTLNGALTFTGDTIVKKGTLNLLGTSTSNTFIEPDGTLGGTGTITGNVINRGTVSPGISKSSGISISTFTINNGTYKQEQSGTLALEVNGTRSDLLLLTGKAVVTDLAGTVKISGTPTPGFVYTGIAGPTAYKGTAKVQPDTSSVVIVNAAAYLFCREDDPCFKKLQGSPSVDPTKLQFGWAALDLKGAPVPIKDTTPQQAITYAKNNGGPLSKIVTDSTDGLKATCVANTADPKGCNAGLNKNGNTPPVSGNIVATAKPLDGGNAAIAAVVNNGVTGGTPIPTSTGASTGYTTKQAEAAGLPADFVKVLNAVNSLPTRSAVISSLHQVTAEPYASMQSVALEAMEQFRTNALALTNGEKAFRLWTDADMCQTSDGKLIPANSNPVPSDCKPRKVSQASRWSLLIDATNTQANLDGTNDLASLDYNIFQSTYGLQYDASKQWSIGAAFGYGQANLYNYEYTNSSIDSDTYSAGAWAIYRPSDPWKITALVGYMNLQYDSSRNINFGGLNRTATANWSGNGFTTALEAEYDWILSANKSDRNAIRLKPNTYLAYSLHSQGNITESGADSLNLAINGHTADSLVYGIGFTLETPIQLASRTRLIPRLSVGYEHDFNGNANEEHQLSASFAEVPALGSLDVLGQNRGADDLNVALNLELETSDQFSLYAGVGGSFWSNGNELSYGGGLRWRFGGAPRAAMTQTQPLTPAPAGDSVTPIPQP